MNYLRFFLVLFLIGTAPASAMLHIPREQAIPSRTASTNRTKTIQEFLHHLPFFPDHKFHKRGKNPDDRYASMEEGKVAFICSMFFLLCLGAVALSSLELFLIPAFMLACAASILGAIGIKRRNPVFATLGLILGILEIVAAIIVLALIAF